MAEGKCGKCNRAFSKTAVFCKWCGAKLHAESNNDEDIKILNEETLAEAVRTEEEGELFPFADAAPTTAEDDVEPEAPEVSEASAAPVPTPEVSPFTLEVLDGLSAGRKVRLHNSLPLTVGSSSKADLTVDDSSVSRRHATFRVEDGRLYVNDEGSTNKTLIYVDGEHELAEGDCLILGDTLLKVVKE